MQLSYLSDSQPDPIVPKKLKIPIIARYEDAITIPILLSPQKGMKCCNISPFEVSPQMKNVIAKIQNAAKSPSVAYCSNSAELCG